MPAETTPGPPSGPPTELQQLEAALAAGVITPELFATLKSKLRPAESAAPRVPPPSSEELPSLLDMFSRAPGPVEVPAGPAPIRPETSPAAPLVAASPPPTTAQDAAARQRIEDHLARLRQSAPTPPPASPPSFYPEPPAPVFFPDPKPMPASVLPPAPPVARPRPAPAPDGRSRSWLLVLLLLAVVGGLAYYFTSSSHPDEELGSTKHTATEQPPVAVPAPKAPQRPKTAHRVAKHKKKTAHLAHEAVLATDSAATETLAEDSPAESPTPTTPKAAGPLDFSQPIPAIAEAGDDAAATKVRAAMASYYADLYAPPLHASEHFAPQVERLYIKQNLTPEAIEAELARSFFPDNQHAVCQIEPGTLHVSDPAADGSRTATFIERMRLYRVSLQKYQRLRTQVRVRFNADNKIVYMRQEKLLTNLFEQ